MANNETILVTGATGFLGSALCEALLKKGYRVIGLDRKTVGGLTGQVIKNHNFSFINIDLSEEMLKINGKIDGVYHLATVALQKNSVFEGYVVTEMNMLKNLQQLVKHNEVKWIFYSSTCSVFSEPQNIFSENTCPTPKSHYALSKFCVERLLLKDFKVKCTIIRFPAIFGKGDSRSIIHNFYVSAKENIPIGIYSNRLRNIIFIEDAIDVMIKAFINRKTLSHSELFIAGSSNSLRPLEIANNVKELLNSKSDIILESKKIDFDFDVVLDISKSKELLTFSPLTIEEGLERYIKSIEADKYAK